MPQLLHSGLKMARLLLLMVVMLPACAATPQDLSGKMFTFPQETNTAHVRLNTPLQSFSAVTVCLRSVTDLVRAHSLFSLATPSVANGFLIFKAATRDAFDINVQDKAVTFGNQNYELNEWHSICSTWDTESGLVQLWVDGKASIKKFTSGSAIKSPIVILGQEQDSYGGGFDMSQSFVGAIHDVHMWNYVLSPCEIQRYTETSNFTPGNVLNWRALDFQITGRVLIEDRSITCN
ncbi:C-reactive protein-like [Mugil cephalus]|uniref:C-reactive protein-like n=1 Tax=Mugil cephalus TaxID=48193 RepID=UPI001FB5BC21|nr:C-reactive protein-like [Mugil cephalus]